MTQVQELASCVNESGLLRIPGDRRWMSGPGSDQSVSREGAIFSRIYFKRFFCAFYFGDLFLIKILHTRCSWLASFIETTTRTWLGERQQTATDDYIYNVSNLIIIII